MKISYLWLKEFVDFDFSPEELAVVLRNLGFDNAGIRRFGGELANVVTARVEERGKHPQADRLSLCRVFDGKDRWSVVCGAPNVAAGQTVALARVGARLPDGMLIEKRAIRGQESQGMICSAKELGLGEDHAGILELPLDLPLGQSVSEALALDDAVLDLEVTPNRPDMLSHWGAAREVAAATGRRLRLPDMDVPRVKRLPSLVKIEEPALCGRYIGRVIEGAAVKPSPLWMKLRLERCGIRSISNVVDATNYVLLELGHPLHAFDRGKLAEGRVAVRRARDGESLLCLDGVERSLKPEDLVIADADRPQALAGIIGGQASAVEAGSRDLLLESACFAASAVRRARGRHGVSTESSYRFERGVDAEVAEWASRRAAHLILKLAGGEPAGELDVRPAKARPAAVKAGPDRINALLGTSFPSAAVKKSLEKLGFSCRSSGKALSVSPPAHRQDVREEADLAEEVARLTGYDKVPSAARFHALPPEPESVSARLARSARSFMTGAGFFEARNYGLVSRRQWEDLAGGSEGALELENPLSLSGELLAPGLLAGLCRNLQTNMRRGNKNARLFEIAAVFRRADGSGRESQTLAWAAEGNTGPEHWRHKPRPLEFWDAKTWMKALLKEWRVAGVRFESGSAPVFLHPAESQAVTVGGRSAGFFGKIHPRRAELLDVPAETFLAELDLSALAEAGFQEVKFVDLPKYPAVYRDFSLVFSAETSWSTVALRVAGGRFPWVEDVELFDVFAGAGLPAGRRSLAFRVTLRNPERTLTDAEAAAAQEDILSDLKSAFGAEARGQAAPGDPA
ncbi:MAG: phenylalanine--tRNA ligase subunit beta [Elusimicrobiota bacterium]